MKPWKWIALTIALILICAYPAAAQQSIKVKNATVTSLTSGKCVQTSTGGLLTDAGTACGTAVLGSSTQPYEIHLGIPGTPAASLIIPDTCAQTISFPANFTTPTSVVSCGTNPGEADDYIIKVAGARIGDISISTSCVATLTTVSHATESCTAGQRIEVDGPATVSGANISIVVVGTRAL